MKVLCVIPARGGSKGMPGKNLRRVAGATLIARSVFQAREFARRTQGHDIRVLVDTDSEEIAREARDWGAEVPFLRDAKLAGDLTSTADTVVGLLKRMDGQRFEAVVLLQPTSPLRTVEEISRCWERFLAGGGRSSVATARPMPASTVLGAIDGSGALRPVAPIGNNIRRQDVAPVHELTGSVYVIAVSALVEKSSFLLPGATEVVDALASTSIDIDTEEELAFANAASRLVPETSVDLAGRKLGAGHPCFVIAEAGVNHNGDPSLALELVDKAAEAGADSVKFQTFDTASLVSETAPKAEYQVASTAERGTQKSMLDALTLPRSVYVHLVRRARDRGLLFMSTPFDAGSADFLDELGCPAFKIGSGDLTNHPLLSHIARKGKPVLLSTGMSTLAEVARAVEVVRAAGDPPLVLLHCVSQYPVEPRECNLAAMDSMRSLFSVPVGWSDHTQATAVPVAAAAMGAAVIEKHFTISRDMKGPDHSSSLEPGELASMIRAIRDGEMARGDGIKVPAASELPNRAVVRRSLHAATDLAAGASLRLEDVAALRPGGGIAPSELDNTLGRRLRAAVRKGEMLTPEHFD